MSPVTNMLATSTALLDVVPIAIVIHDKNGKPYFVNGQARKLFGSVVDPDIPAGQILADVEIFVADTDTRYRLDHLDSVATFRTGEHELADMEIRHPDGTVHLEVSVKPSFDASGLLSCVTHTFSDTSGRKNTDADLRLTESLAKAVSTEPGFEDVLRTSLHEICQLTGWTFGQAWLPNSSGSRLRCRYFWHDDTAGLSDFHEASVRHDLAHGDGLPGRAWQTKQWEWNDDITSDPDEAAADVSAEPMPSGHRASVAMPVLVGDDVVAVLEFFVLVGGSQDQRSLDRVAAVVSRVGLWMSTKGAEDAVDRIEGQFRKIAESASDAIVSAGSDNRIIYMNPSAERMFGYTAHEVLGRSMTQLVHDRSDVEGGTDFGRYSQVGRGGLMGPPVYLAAVSKGGKEFPVEMNLTSWQQGKETFLTAIVRDASNRVQAEQRLEDALGREREVVEQLNVLDGLKYTVLQTLAHDLRTPIAAILVMTGILRDYSDAENLSQRGVTPAARGKLLGDIELSVRKMERLLQDLINADPMQSIEARRAPCDVAELVNRAVVETHIRTHHPVHTNLKSVTVNVDIGQVERIVENLLNNAAKHVALGVDIWVSTARAEDGGVIIAVEDAGTGVPDEMKEQIFEAFRRGGEPMSPGLGLGLSLVSRFAEVHGGRVWVEDRVGGGASFNVYLPDSAVVVDTHAEADRVRVLVCDDDEMLSGALATLINLDNTLELACPPVRTGDNAIDAVARYRPDVVVIDVDLIGSMTGFQATNRIKELFPSTQVIIMSGMRNSDGAQLDSIEAGAWGFLAKTQIMTKFLPFVREAAEEGRRG